MSINELMGYAVMQNPKLNHEMRVKSDRDRHLEDAGEFQSDATPRKNSGRSGWYCQKI